MDNDQAQEILGVLIESLTQNGFSEQVGQTWTRAIQSRDEYDESLPRSPKGRLKIFLENIVPVFESISSSSLPKTLATINENIENFAKIDGIDVQLIDESEYNLAKLPDYTEIINVLTEVRNRLTEE